MGFDKFIGRAVSAKRGRPGKAKPEASVVVFSLKGGALSVRLWLYSALCEHLGVVEGDGVVVGIGKNDSKGKDYGSVVIMNPTNKSQPLVTLKTIHRGGKVATPGRLFLNLPVSSFPTVVDTIAETPVDKVEKLPDSDDGRMIGIVLPQGVVPR